MAKITPVSYETAPKSFWKAHRDCLWGLPDDERYQCDQIDDAIEDYINNGCYPDKPPAIIEMTAMRPHQLLGADKIVTPDGILNDILERLDEQYGDPEGECTVPTVKMHKAAQKLVDAIYSDYKVWLCDHVASVLVNTKKWLKDNE